MKIGFIGCGKMGGALARAAAKSQPADGEAFEIYLCDRNAEAAAALAQEINAQAAACETAATKSIAAQAISIEKLALECGYIFLGVKPQGMADMLLQISDILANRQAAGEDFILVTMAAGLKTSDINKLAGGTYKFIRIMPNLPVSVGEGMIIYALSGIEYGSDAEEIFTNILEPAGALLYCADEAFIDPGMAISGCGPAFVAMLLEGFIKGGERCGLSTDDAKVLAMQTIIGTATLLEETDQPPMDLCRDVCSPGGTTIEGVKVLEDAGFISSLADAVEAAYRKAERMRGQ